MKQRSAKRIKLRNNIIVHTILAVLAAVWMFPVLRVYQQYFMVSAGAQMILEELTDRGFAPDTLSDHVAIQINDTHPSMVIPELIRLLTTRGLSMEAAVAQVEKACAYTNHTILAEALEKWPVDYIETVAPQLVPIIRELDSLARRRSGDPG